MRLINAQTLQLEDFTLREVPPYAILSHTWGGDEVTFQDMLSGRAHLRSTKGYDKIRQTCRFAWEYGLNYAWVDTCCIDKSSSAELTESINSMFGYYQRSAICFALLADSRPGSSNIRSSRWFTRGWTLQELIAPPRLIFYHQDWSHYADKSEISRMLSEITRIPCDVLADSSKCSCLSVATKMSWAAERRTTRLEDTAYSLLGIFDINMPLIYGEGHKAFIRLQEEIIKRVNDLTIFAWQSTTAQNRGAGGGNGSLLATSPSVFGTDLILSRLEDQSPEFSVTNKGLLVSADTPLGHFSIDNRDDCLAICLGYAPHNGGVYTGRVFLRLQKIGPSLLRVSGRQRLMWFDRTHFTSPIRWLESLSSYHIVMDSDRAQAAWDLFRRHAISLPRWLGWQEGFHVDWVIPEDLWDPESQTFLRPKPFVGSFFPMVLAISVQIRLANGLTSMIIVCENMSGDPSVGTITDQIKQGEFFSIMGEHRERSMPWTQFAAAGVEIRWTPKNTVVMEPRGHERSSNGHSIVIDAGAGGVADIDQVSVYLERVDPYLIAPPNMIHLPDIAVSVSQLFAMGST